MQSFAELKGELEKMLKPKIAMLGYKEFIELASNIVKENNDSYEMFIHSCYKDECISLLPKLIEKKIDIIITGNINKEIFESICNIPVIAFRITPYDILSSIKKTINSTKRIAITIPSIQDLYDYTLLSELLNIELKMISFENELDLRESIKEFSREEGVVIGSSLSVSIAREYGLIGHLVYSLESTIEESIQRATEIVYFKRKEEKFNTEFKAIMNSVNDGILTTNNQGEVTLMNSSATNLLKLANDIPQRRKLEELLPPRIYHEFIKDHLDKHSLVNIGNTTVALSRTPIYVKDYEVGNVYTFNDITDVQEIDNKFRIQNRESTWKAKVTFDDIINHSALMKRVVEEAKRFSQTDSTILIKGETGTGKEMFAQSIHNHSSRKLFPFVAINCAALPDSLLESELFGHKTGAFTGASQKGRKGLFEIAHKGTIFLDEINSTSTSFQVKLLRVLQEKEIVPIGSDKVVKVDIRIIAAANGNLLDLVKTEKFRSDLYYRLNVLEINIPPLRFRLEDLPMLIAQYFSKDLHFYRQISSYIPIIADELSQYGFPGNVRELLNILERFTLLCDITKVSDLSYLKDLLLRHIDFTQGEEDIAGILIPVFPANEPYKEALKEAERALVRAYHEASNGNKTKLAKLMGVTRSTLYRKLNELNLEDLL
ncbi:sigma 54-interacting transcriptional regulator [Bacillus sp. MRMR6]|uniref:sigma 54-interacting transcriptional regulator n=1 Tax=Bacillus sp. MRMR6 TaxID=1928617 RepID=UPI0009525CA1|nr:sigma 54-interacting transcriptional regulator [Bacillus sp. MRMR6]OLS33869.1 hypothetical protein BTR25_23700 [Bacillus sp. MRMR6]